MKNYLILYVEQRQFYRKFQYIYISTRNYFKLSLLNQMKSPTFHTLRAYVPPQREERDFRPDESSPKMETVSL